MHKFLTFWLNRPVSLIILTVITLLLGALSLYHLPLELSPAVDFPRVSINVYYPDSTPEIIEAMISAPIESRMQEISALRKTESVSGSNNSRVTLQFDRKADMAFIMFRINEILGDYKNWLPKGVMQPSISQYIPDEFKQENFLSYRLLTDLSESSLYNIVEEEIKRPLLNVSGIGAVEIFGLRTPQVEILIDYKKMKEYEISIADVRRAIKGLEIHCGYINKNQSRIPVSLDARFQTVESIKRIPFNLTSFRNITLSDFALIKEGYRKLRYKKRINGKHTVMISLQKESGSNAISVADRVFKAVQKITKKLPSGNQLIMVNDSSEELRKALNDLFLRAIIALFSIFILLLLILKRIIYAWIILISIILSVSMVFICIYLFDYSINLLTLAGLSLGFGFIVDNSIIVFDNIEKQNKPADIVSSALKVIFPIIAATLTTLTALAPFIFLTEELQILYIPFAVVVSAALLSSVAFAFLFVPSAYRHLHKSSNHSRTEPFLIIHTFYKKILLLFIKYRKTAIFLTIWTFGFPLWLLPEAVTEDENTSNLSQFLISAYNQSVGSDWYNSIRTYSDPLIGGSSYLFFKYVKRGEPWNWSGGTYLMVYIQMPQGSDIGLSEKLILGFEKIALSENGVGKVETTISQSVAGMRVDFPSVTAYSALPYMLKEKLISRASKVGGVYISVSGYGDGFASGFGGSIANYRLRLKGYNYLELKNIATNLKFELERNRRVRDVDINTAYGFGYGALYELEMNLNRQVIASMSLRPSDILPLLQSYTSETLSADKIRIGLKEKYLTIKSNEFFGMQLDQLNSKWFEAAGLPPFRLGQFSTIEKKKMLPEIRRENQQYIRILSFDFLGPFEFGREYLLKKLGEFNLPVGYSIEHRYKQWEREEEKNIIFVIFIGLLFIYMVTAALYESFRDPFLIFLTIPAGLIGVFLAFYFFNTTFNRSAYIGVLFISGIVVNNSIILISKYKNLQKGGADLKSAVLQGSINHIRPLFLTSATTILGFLPMVLLSVNKSGDLWHTLALTGISGIISSFVFILIILPVLYYSMEFKHTRKNIF